MRTLFRPHLLVACLACVATTVFAQENYSQWQKYRTLTVNTKASGANLPGAVANFPVLVRLDSANAADVFTGTLAAGADVRFTNAAGTVRRAHQVEFWDAVAKKAAFWVLADTVKANDSTVSLRLYWGKSGAVDSSNPAAVFDTSKGYQGVWHLGDMNDATVNANAGTNTGTIDTTGVVGRGRYFNGTSNYISVGNSAKMNSSLPFTIEGWVNWASIGTGTTSRYRPLLTHGTSGTNGNQVFLQPRRPSSGGTNPYYSFGFYNGTATNDAQASGLNDSATWVHLTGAYDGTSWMIYRNGVLAATTARSGTVTNATTNWFIGGGDGNGATTPSRYYFGSIDEVRYSNVVRDSNWARLSYELQKPTASAVVLGATQTTAPIALGALAYGNPAKAADTLIMTQGNPVSVPATYTGGPVDSVKVVSGALPAGLAVNKTTGLLSGTPTTVAAAANVVIRAWGHAVAGDSVSRTVRISVAAGGLANFKYNPDTTTYTTGLAVTNAPSWTGRAPTKFQVTAGALPAGLSLDTATGLITGAPTTAAAAANVTVRATNTAGPDTATRTLRLTVAAESYGTWAQRDTLWLNTQPGGAGTTTNVLNFPVLIRLDSAGGFSSVFTQSFGQGADLRFTKADNATRLPHQIEQWDSAGKRASVWVLVDTVLPNSRTQVVRMLWGKAGAQNASHGPSVFDTAKGFRAVFHFGEGAGIDTVNDATQYRFKGVPGRTATTYSFPEDTAGAVGRGRRFGVTSPATTVNSAGSYFTVPGSASPLNFPEGGPYTLSTWVIVRNAGTSKTFVSKSDRAYSLEFRNTGADWEFAEHNTTAGGWVVAGSPAATAGAGGASTIDVWTHITGVRGGGTSVLYVNGVAQTQALRTDANTNAHVTNVDLNIGRAPDNNTSTTPRYYWRGVLDEVRVANVARSADWAKLEYENQKANQTLVTTVQPPVGIASHVARTEGFGVTVKAHGRGLLFRLQGQDGLAGRATLTLLDVGGRAVWNGTFDKGTLAWDGISLRGGNAAQGLYLARIEFRDAHDKLLRVLDRKIPYAP